MVRTETFVYESTGGRGFRSCCSAEIEVIAIDPKLTVLGGALHLTLMF